MNQTKELNGILLKGLNFIFQSGRMSLLFICINSFDKNKI